MTIRQAHLPDSAAVATLFDQYRVFYGKRSDRELARTFIGQRLQRDESTVFVHELPDALTGATRISGFVQLYPSFSSVSAARVYVLNDLYVDAAFRRQGVARELLLAAQAFAQSKGAVRLALATNTANHSAQALYESLGWSRDDAFIHYSYALPPVAP